MSADRCSAGIVLAAAVVVVLMVPNGHLIQHSQSSDEPSDRLESQAEREQRTTARAASDELNKNYGPCKAPQSPRARPG